MDAFPTQPAIPLQSAPDPTDRDLEQLREILFGPTAREISQQFAALSARASEQAAEHQRLIAQHTADLEALRQALAQYSERLDRLEALTAQNQHHAETVATELPDIRRVLEWLSDGRRQLGERLQTIGERLLHDNLPEAPSAREAD